MLLYPDLFESVRTIRDAVVHLDVQPEATPILCYLRRVPNALRNSLKTELDRRENMEIIRKLDINKASDSVHALVLVVKPNGRLHLFLDPRTLNTVL